VQATMGSITRVNVVYKNLAEILSDYNVMNFGAFMDGKNIYEEDLPQSGVLVLGNEANGIQSKIEALIKKRISITRFGNLKQTESLNVANATAILLSEFRRKNH